MSSGKEYKSSEEKSVDHEPTKKTVVVIGDGGLGKTSLVNAIAGTHFQTGDVETDITIDMQRAYIGDTVIIDTPGASHNIEKWWSDLHGLGKVHGVILLVTRQHRASAYGVFYYVCKYLEVNKLPFRLYWGGEYREFTDPENFLYGAFHRSVLQKPAGIADVRKWMANLDEDFAFSIFHPAQLFQELKNSKSSIAKMQEDIISRDRTIVEQSVEIQQVTKSLEESRRMLTVNGDSLREKLKHCTELAERLTVADSHKATGRKANKPGKINYSWTWVPGGGSVVLTERRAFGREVFKLAQDIIDTADLLKKEEGEKVSDEVVVA